MKASFVEGGSQQELPQLQVRTFNMKDTKAMRDLNPGDIGAPRGPFASQNVGQRCTAIPVRCAGRGGGRGAVARTLRDSHPASRG